MAKARTQKKAPDAPDPARARANKANARPASPPSVGIVGLGIMGSAISANLVKAGFAVFGYDLRAPARARLKKCGGTPCGSAREVAKQCRFIVLSLPSEAALDEVCAQLAAAGVTGTVVAETSTLPEAAKSRAREALSRRGIALLDCPLSGTGAQAVTGDLTVYASGDPGAIESFAPIFAGFSRARYDVGAFGNGMRMKLVANLLVAIHNVATAEALLLGGRMGLDPAQVVKVVGDGAGASRMFQVRGPMMVARAWDQATMKLSVWQKDMRLIADALNASDTPAPLFAACAPLYNAAMALGHGNDDPGAVYRVLEQWVNARPQARPARSKRKS